MHPVLMSKNLEISRLCDAYGALLTENMRRTVREYYDYDLSLAEIAEQQGVTRQAVLCRLRQAEGKLLEYERLLGVVNMTDRLCDELSRIAESCGTDAIAARNAIGEVVNGIKEWRY